MSVRLGPKGSRGLTTRGSRTGLPRKTTIVYFPDERPGSWLVVASNAGAAAHRAWAINLARHPDNVSIKTGGSKIVRT